MSTVEDHIMGLGCNPNNSSDSVCSSEQMQYLDQFCANVLATPSLQNFLAKENAGAWWIECYLHQIVNFDNQWLLARLAPEEETQSDQARLGASFSEWYTTGKAQVNVDGQWGQGTNCAW